LDNKIAASNANSKVNATVASIKLENNLITAFSMQMDEMCILIILGLIVAQLSINNQAPKHTHTHTHTHTSTACRPSQSRVPTVLTEPIS